LSEKGDGALVKRKEKFERGKAVHVELEKRAKATSRKRKIFDLGRIDVLKCALSESESGEEKMTGITRIK